MRRERDGDLDGDGLVVGDVRLLGERTTRLSLAHMRVGSGKSAFSRGQSRSDERRGKARTRRGAPKRDRAERRRPKGRSRENISPKRRFGRSASRSPADAPAARRRRGRRTCWTRTSARQRGEACPRSWRTWHRLCASARVACGASGSNAREKRVFRKSAFGLWSAASREGRGASRSLGDDRAFVCYLFHDARLRPRRIRARARPPGDLPSARRARCPRWPRCRPRRTSSRSGRATCP